MSDNHFEYIYKLLYDEKDDLIAMSKNTDNLYLFSDCINKIEQIIIAKEVLEQYEKKDKAMLNSFYGKFAEKQNITNDYLNALQSCSADLNLIKQKDYSQLIRLFKCAEEQNECFVKDVEAFDELVSKLETGEFRIVKSLECDNNA